MANNKKISQLTAFTLTGPKLVPVVQGGVTVQTTTQDIADLSTSGVQSVTGSNVDNTDPNNPIVNPLGLIQIVDKDGDFFTDLASASAYIRTITSATITDESYNNGVYFFTLPTGSTVSDILASYALTTASLIDEFGLITNFDLDSIPSFSFNGGNHKLGKVTFWGLEFDTFSGIVEIEQIVDITYGTVSYFAQTSTGKFIIKGNIGLTPSGNSYTCFLNSTATILVNKEQYTINSGGIQGDLVTAITNGCNVQFDGIDLATLNTNQTLTNKTLDGPIITVGAINVSPTELSYLDGVTSSIQTQLNNKGSSTPVYSTKWLTAPFATLPNSIGNFAGAIFYIPISVSKTMTLTDLRMEVTAGVAASNIRLAIYNDNNGAPSTLLDQSTAISSAVIGQKDYTLVSPITIQASDQKFWLAVQASVNGVGLRSSISGVCLNLLAGSGVTGVMSYEIQAFGAFPATSTPTLNPSQQVILMAAKLQ